MMRFVALKFLGSSLEGDIDVQLALEVVKRVALAFSCIVLILFCTTTGLEWILTLVQTGGRSGKESQKARWWF